MNLWQRLSRVVNSGLSIAERMVLVVIAYHSDRTSAQCRLSVATIAREAGITSRGVQKILVRLQQDGWIERHAVVRSGRKAASVFTLGTSLESPAGIANHVPYSEGPEIGNGVPRMGNGVPKNREPRSDRTCIEPVLNLGARGGVAPRGAPPRARNADPEGEDAHERRNRQLLDLAIPLKLKRRIGENEAAFLRRIEHANRARQEQLEKSSR